MEEEFQLITIYIFQVEDGTVLETLTVLTSCTIILVCQ